MTFVATLRTGHAVAGVELPQRGILSGTLDSIVFPWSAREGQDERLRGWLDGDQWKVQEAGNGREALAVLKDTKPDVILLDLMMPEMDGFAVVAALQKEPRWSDIPVVVVTARDLDAKDRERLNSGVQSVLVKETFRPADLVEQIRRLANNKPQVGSEMEAAS